MRIRTKILLSHMTLAATVAIFSIIIIYSLHLAGQSRHELTESYRQIHNLNRLNSDGNYLVEQIAELLILGPQDAEMHTAHVKINKRLAKQRGLISSAVERINDPGKRAEERHELDRVDKIERVVRELNAVYHELEGKLAAGHTKAAAVLYGDKVENDLDDKLETLITAARGRERSQIQESIAASERLARESLWLAIAMVVFVVILGLLNIVTLNRTVLHPLTALARAADAVGRGELSHVVAVGGADDLGNLTRRFNQMTGRVKAQHDALRRANENLEQKVAERTQEVVARSRELESVNAHLREVDANRAQFFADISHELRTPLTVIRGRAEVALRPRAPDPAQTRSALEAIVRKAGQMGQLVEDMLFLASSQAGAIRIEKRPTKLQEVIGDALIDSQTLAREAGIVLTPHQPIEPVTVYCDRDRIRQALTILLDNAIKFAPEGTTVAIALAQYKGWATIKVRDAGPGFSREAAERAFMRFRGRERAGERGAGLGLAIAKWIVEQHGGTIAIERTSGAGTTVAIELPLTPEAT